MRILFVTPSVPLPTGGAGTRTHNIMRQLSEGHEVVLLSFVQPHELESVGSFMHICDEVVLVPFHGFPQRSKWRNRFVGWRELLLSNAPQYVTTFPIDDLRIPLRKLQKSVNPDLVVLDQLFVAELVNDVTTAALLVEHNVESAVAWRMSRASTSVIHKLRDYLIWRKLDKYERKQIVNFHTCIAVSESDAKQIRQISPQTHVSVVPNGVDTSFFRRESDSSRRQELLFLGTLNYGPNIEGITWFCRRVLPIIHQEQPDIRVKVVGANPTSEVLGLSTFPNVDVLGFVPDVRPFLWNASVCIVPLLSGGGTRLKILEALAAECAVVSTTVGAEGLNLKDEIELFLADDPDSFATKTIRLIKEPDLRRQLSQSGRHTVVSRFDWRSIAQEMEVACQWAIASHRG